MSKLSTYRSLNSFEKKVLIQSLVLLPALRIGLQFITYRRIMDTLRRTSDNGSSSPDALRVIAQSEPMVRAAAHYRFSLATCLTRSMTLWWILRRQGIESDIHFGVRREDGGIAAHAWVERDGNVINDRSDVRQIYATFDGGKPISRLDWK